MVLPEGTQSSSSEKSRKPRLAGVGAAVAVLLVGLFALGQLTGPSEDGLAAEESTTTSEATILSPTTTTTIDAETFSVNEITTGDRFSWFKSPSVGSFWPLGLVSHDGLIYLFGSEETPERSRAGLGLSAWSSEDGIGWNRLGDIISQDHAVFEVVSTGSDLVALTVRVDDGAPVVWTSPDGSQWTPSELPVDPEFLGSATFRLNDAVSFRGELIVVGSVHPSSFERVTRALPEELVGDDPFSVRLGFDMSPDGGVVNVYGPLGIHAFSIGLEELGLGDLTESDLFGQQSQARQFLWSSSDGVSWDVDELESSLVRKLWLRPDDVLVAYGPGDRESTVLLSEDGDTWEQQPRYSLSLIPAQTVWDGALVGGQGEHIVTTRDGLDWEPLGTGVLLPDAINWELDPVAGGEAGLAVVASALEANVAPTFSPVIIEKDGSTLTVDLESPVLRLDHSDAGTITIPLWTGEPSDLLDVDLLAEQVTFRRPGTDETLLTVDFATLARAESSAVSYDTDAERALLFTPNGSDWSVQSLTEEIGAASAVDAMVVLGDRVVMVTSPPRALQGNGEAPSPTIRVGMIR